MRQCKPLSGMQPRYGPRLRRHKASPVSLWQSLRARVRCLHQVVGKAKDWAWVIGSTAAIVVLPLMLEVRAMCGCLRCPMPGSNHMPTLPLLLFRWNAKQRSNCRQN